MRIYLPTPYVVFRWRYSALRPYSLQWLWPFWNDHLIFVYLILPIRFTRYSGFLMIYWLIRSDNDQMTDLAVTTFSLQWLFFGIEGRRSLAIVVSGIVLYCLLLIFSNLKWVLTIIICLSPYHEDKKPARQERSGRHSLQWLRYRMSRMVSLTKQSYFTE